MTAIERTPDHHYVYDGVTYPGTTTILRIIDKSDALMGWAARMTAEAAVSMSGTLPHLIENVGPEGAVKALTSRSAWKRDEAAMLGTEVHAMADLLQRGGALPAMSEAALHRVDLYERWWRSSGWTLRASEALLVNTALGYGGTLDLLCYDADGKTVLADIKTGNVAYNGRVYPEIILQQTAYGMAELIETAAGLYPMPAVDRYALVHVTVDRCGEIPLTVGAREEEAFGYALGLARWRATIGGKVL